MVLLNNLTGTSTTESGLVLDANYDGSSNDGTLTLVNGKRIDSVDSNIVMTAWDLVLDGDITATDHTISLFAASSLQTVAVGTPGTKDM